MLEARGLSKRFGSVVAVENLSFCVAEGEIFALLGPSGCGKTTALRLIAGLVRPDRGRVFLAGQDVTSWPPERRKMGFVFQNYALFPHLSVAANVAYGLRFGWRGDRKKRVGELLELVNLVGYEKRRPHELSEGQKQRVALARALAPGARILLLDEPLSALDAALRKELRAELRGLLQGLNIAAVHVTHDQEEALALADRVGVMREGTLEQVGTPHEVYRQPASVFVASFLGRANLWPARVIEVDGQNAWVEVAGTTLSVACAGVEVGQEVVLFFRPEDVEVGSGPFEAEVTHVEYLGDRWEVHTHVQDLAVVLLIDRPCAPRTTLNFHVHKFQILGPDYAC